MHNLVGSLLDKTFARAANLGVVVRARPGADTFNLSLNDGFQLADRRRLRVARLTVRSLQLLVPLV